MLSIAKPLLTWFYENRRLLPFREDPTPYHIWVSEIMLQQTRMTAVLPYYDRFIRALPSVADLASCDRDRLHKLWEGLGYYSRADNLKRAAEVICEIYGGELPANHKALLSLPGIGPYTAGAIASISFGIPVPAVDGNVMRVISRLYNDRADITLGVTKERVSERVMHEMPKDAPGDFNQALMELGALVCTPGEAKCETCPLSELCSAYAAGTVSALPVKAQKKPRRIENITVFLVHSEAGWLLHRRAPSGLLKNMWQPWTLERECTEEEIRSLLSENLKNARIVSILPNAKHIFTHIEWHMRAYRIDADADALPEGCIWAKESAKHAIPNAFKAYKDILTSE